MFAARWSGIPHGQTTRLLCVMAVLGITQAGTGFCESMQRKFEPRWEALDQRTVARWWADAKFGVYIHWTLAAVPSWGLHETFYWPALLKSKEREGNGQKISMEEMMSNLYDNSYRGVWEFHVKNFGADFEFPQFASMFKAELFDA